MDYSVIRPNPPSKKPMPPAPVSSAPPASNGGAKPLPSPPPPSRPPVSPFTPYMEAFDTISQMQGVDSIERTMATTWKMNFHRGFDEYSGRDFSHDYNHRYYPPQGGYGYPMHEASYMLPGPPPHLPLPPPQDYHHRALSGPPPDYCHRTPYGPPPPFAMPPAYRYGQPRMRPDPYSGHSYPYDGGLFSDENPNGCWIM